MNAPVMPLPVPQTKAANPPVILEGVAHQVSEAGHIKPTLAPLDHSFAPGLLHVVGGPSGAGKTTLLSILALAVTPACGQVWLGAENLSRFAPAAQQDWRRAHLGLIFQTVRLVSVMTVGDHVALAAAIRRRPDAIADGRRILASLGLESKLTHRPDQLSGGEKQRVAIAQTLCACPSVLLADEPTAALDHANAQLVADTLRAYAQNQNAVVICVSHDRALLDHADELLMLEKA
jgi:putative ABC transport system ATP-binding protein